MSVVGVIRMSKVSSNLRKGFQSGIRLKLCWPTYLEQHWSELPHWLLWDWQCWHLQVSCWGPPLTSLSLGPCINICSRWLPLHVLYINLYASSLLIIYWAFSAAVFSRNIDPCPGLPGHVTWKTVEVAQMNSILLWSRRCCALHRKVGSLLPVQQCLRPDKTQHSLLWTQVCAQTASSLLGLQPFWVLMCVLKTVRYLFIWDKNQVNCPLECLPLLLQYSHCLNVLDAHTFHILL